LLDAIAAVPTNGIHKWLFSIARQLWPHRDREEIISLLTVATGNARRTVPQREIAEAVDKAKSCQWQPSGRGQAVFAPQSAKKWPDVNHEQRAAILRNGGGLADLWEISPWRIEDNESHAEKIVDLLFPGNPLLCCGRSSYDFETKLREDWRGALHTLQLIVPSPMSKPTGLTKDGRESAHTLDNTGLRRFLVIEFDEGTSDEHAAILLHLATRAPLVLAVHSGGKSLHGWFYCAGQPEDTLRRFMEYAVSLGADDATWTRSQFVRMPDGTRDGGQRQTVYFLNPKPIKP
jgi:hypothetical protein